MKKIIKKKHIPDAGVAVGYNLAPQPMHHHYRSLITIKVYKAISGWLPGKLVCHHFDGHHASLSHDVHGVLENRKLFPV